MKNAHRKAFVLCAGMAALAVLLAPHAARGQETQPPETGDAQNTVTGAAQALEMAPTAVLDLETAQQRALRDNPSLLAISERVGQAEQMLRQARSLYYPQISMSYSFAYTWLPDYLTDQAGDYLDQAQDVLDDLRWQLRFGPLAGALTSSQRYDARKLLRQLDGLMGDARDRLDGPLETYQLSFTAGWLLFDGFGRHFKNAMARIGVKETQAARREGQRLLLAGVARAYFGVQLARENIAIVRSDLEFNESLLRDTRVLREAGRAATSDVLNFEVAVGAARTMLLRAEREHEAARIALATLMAMPEAVLPHEVQVAPLPGETPAQMQAPEADHLIARALEQRPDLQQNAHAVRRSEAAVRSRYAEFSPQVGAFVRHEAQRFNGTDIRSEDFSTAAGVNVQYDIFTGGRRLARVREAKHAQRESVLRMRETELTVTSEVQHALLDLRTAQQQLILQRTTLDQVRKNRDLVARSYEAGKETLVRLNQAQRDLVRAESQLALARVELQRAWFDLRSATAATLAMAGEPAPDSMDIDE